MRNKDHLVWTAATALNEPPGRMRTVVNWLRKEGLITRGIPGRGRQVHFIPGDLSNLTLAGLSRSAANEAAGMVRLLRSSERVSEHDPSAFGLAVPDDTLGVALDAVFSQLTAADQMVVDPKAWKAAGLEPDSATSDRCITRFWISVESSWIGWRTTFGAISGSDTQVELGESRDWSLAYEVENTDPDIRALVTTKDPEQAASLIAAHKGAFARRTTKDYVGSGALRALAASLRGDMQWANDLLSEPPTEVLEAFEDEWGSLRPGVYRDVALGRLRIARPRHEAENDRRRRRR